MPNLLPHLFTRRLDGRSGLAAALLGHKMRNLSACQLTGVK